MENDLRTEVELARGVGRMVGVAALHDCMSSKGIKGYKQAAELIGYGIKFSPKEFMAGLSEALIIGLTSENDTTAIVKLAILVGKS